MYDTGFWAHHLDFHRPVKHSPALVGSSRSRDIIVNVGLPFFATKAHLLGDADLGRSARALYARIPPGQNDEITREVKRLLTGSNVSRPVVNSARRQQGLIHIYRVLMGRTR